MTRYNSEYTGAEIDAGITKILKPYKPFTTRWLLDDADKIITLPLPSAGTYDFVVDWGDGTTGIVTAYNDADISHTYTTAGIKTVSIMGKMTHWSFNNGGDKLKITDVLRGGYSGLTSLNRGFYGCSNLKFVANDSAWTKDVTDTSYMFYECAAFNSDISAWDVSSVTNMTLMFVACSAFNSDISAWDVSSVTNMYAMFYESPVFNSDISAWDVSSVTNMAAMFSGATAFNSDISAWDVSSVTNMAAVFRGCSVFNSDISAWDVSSVTGMANMFRFCYVFNSDISAWDVSSVTDMANMLNGANAFSTANYDLLLNAWSLLTLKLNVPFHAGDAKYTTTTSQSAHDILTNPPNRWSITDGGGI